jgi:hypothetical protein
MNRFSKLMLSDEELQLVNNPGFILTKRMIIDKVCGLLGALQEDQKTVIENEKHWLPPPVVRSSAKISKGENYLQLPYVLLDHPRCFEAEDIFAVRTMFWWGNFFSTSLHLSGKYKEMFQQKITENLGRIKQEIFICVNENQWQHHFEAGNYVAAKQMPADEIQKVLLEKRFVKLAIKFPLQPWNDIPLLLDGAFKEMIEMLKG